MAVREFQKETITLASRSLDKQSAQRRDISTVTFTVAQKDMDELRERIAEFRSSLVAMVGQSSDADTVYQLNVQLFPMSKQKEQRN
jgi:uncharacterized protein (TIGR02147 family)